MKTANIMDNPFTYTDQATFISILDKQIRSQHKSFIITANPEIVIKANDDPYFMDIINKATHIVADGISTVKRAPVFWQKLNLEWFYRLIKQPRRSRWMMALPRFAIQIINRKVRGSAS